MGIGALGIGALIGAGAGAIKGSQEKRQLKKQADIEEINAVKQATRVAEDAEKLKQKQKLRFIKSGVDLEGSPLLLLEETSEIGAREASGITRIGSQRAKDLKKRGRNLLLSSVIGGATGGFGIGAQFT